LTGRRRHRLLPHKHLHNLAEFWRGPDSFLKLNCWSRPKIDALLIYLSVASSCFTSFFNFSLSDGLRFIVLPSSLLAASNFPRPANPCAGLSGVGAGPGCVYIWPPAQGPASHNHLFITGSMPSLLGVTYFFDSAYSPRARCVLFG
jgi:hypothetical protein